MLLLMRIAAAGSAGRVGNYETIFALESALEGNSMEDSLHFWFF
jgi:hypothetical protein